METVGHPSLEPVTEGTCAWTRLHRCFLVTTGAQKPPGSPNSLLEGPGGCVSELGGETVWALFPPSRGLERLGGRPVLNEFNIPPWTDHHAQVPPIGWSGVEKLTERGFHSISASLMHSLQF